MNQRTERILWFCVLLTGTASLAASSTLSLRRGQEEVAPYAADSRPMEPTLDSLGMIALEVVARDPFRLARAPASLPFAGRHAVASASSRPPKPNLTLTGLLGPPWRAVIEGIPGREGGALVSAGDTIAGLLIRSIRADTVIVRGADTTWRLTVRREW